MSLFWPMVGERVRDGVGILALHNDRCGGQFAVFVKPGCRRDGAVFAFNCWSTPLSLRQSLFLRSHSCFPTSDAILVSLFLLSRLICPHKEASLVDLPQCFAKVSVPFCVSAFVAKVPHAETFPERL